VFLPRGRVQCAQPLVEPFETSTKCLQLSDWVIGYRTAATIVLLVGAGLLFFLSVWAFAPEVWWTTPAPDEPSSKGSDTA
jgi:hypothetical protein